MTARACVQVRLGAPLALLIATACGQPSASPPPKAPAAILPSPPPPASVPDPVTPDAPFRRARPESGPAPTFTPPKIVTLALSSGVPVYLVERHDLPVLDVDVIVRGGTSALAHGEYWAARAATELSMKGAGGRDALAVADALSENGAKLDFDAWSDFVRASLKVPVQSAEKALAVLGEAVARPALSEAELSILREAWKARQEKLATERDTLSTNLTELTLYGPTHPYGHARIASPGELDAIKVTQLHDVHRRLFARERAAVIVVGDVTRDTIVPLLEKSFAAWKPAKVAPRVVPPPSPPATKGPRIALVDLRGSAQSLVYAAEPGIAATSPDRYAFKVMNTILGGFWMSRLNANLREANGYSYWVNSWVSPRRGGGPFRAGGAVIREKTGAAIGEILAEVKGMREREVSAEELEGAKTFLVNLSRASFERVESTAAWLGDNYGLALPIDDWSAEAEQIKKVTAADVKRVAEAYLHPDAMHILVVADSATVGPELTALGLGPVERRDVRGAPIR